MTQELQTKQTNSVISGDVTHGGLTGEDLEIPRCNLLQNTSPALQDGGDLKAGQIINSVTREVLNGLFVPLFAFKQYVKFSAEGKLEWTTLNRNDSRIGDGLDWVDGNTPEVTEFLNVMVSFKSQPDMPLVLSFKSTSMKVGKQFVTLLSLKGKPAYHYWYNIDTKLVTKGSKSWYQPVITMPSDKKTHEVSAKDITKYEQMAKLYSPLVTNVKASESDEQTPF